MFPFPKCPTFQMNSLQNLRGLQDAVQQRRLAEPFAGNSKGVKCEKCVVSLLGGLRMMDDVR